MRSRGRRRTWIIVFLLGLYAAIGYLVLPRVIRPRLEERLTAELQRRVRIGELRIDPFALSATLNRVQILAPGAEQPFAAWRRLHVNFDPLQSLRGDWVIGRIVLEDFRGALEIDESGTLSIADLLEKFGSRDEREPPGGKPSRPWRISRLEVADARVDFVDRSRGELFRTLVGPLNFTLVEFRTAGPRGAPYRFAARTESGEQLDWTGSLTAQPLAFAGDWRIENLLLSKYAPYFDDRINVLLTSGKLTLSGRLDVSLAPDDRRLLLTEGAAELTNLKLVERATGQPVLELPGAEFAGMSADGVARQYSLGTVQLDGGRLVARRDPTGALNLRALLAPRRPNVSRAPAAGPPLTVKSAQPATVTAAEISLRDFTVRWLDETLPRPVDIEFTRVSAALKEFTLADGAAVPVEVTFGVNPQGTARVTGDVGFRPLRTNLDLELAWMPLPPFSAYLERAAPLRLAQGVASLKGRVVYSRNESETGATFTGGGRIEELGLVGIVEGEPLAGFSHLALNDMTLTTTPRPAVVLGASSLSSPYLRVLIDESGHVNLSRIRAAPPMLPGSVTAVVNLPAAESDPAGPLPFDVTVTRLAVDGGEVLFSDQSVQPHVGVSATQIGGVFQDLSSRNPARGGMELRALLNGESPLVVKGRFNPFVAHPFADLAIEGKSIDLRPVAPYVARFAGHELERGEMFFEAQMKLVEQELDLRNTVTLEHFMLGPATPGPDTLKLPVRLGVALLTDASGRIVFDLPVQGSLADPQFRPGAVVGQAITSTLAKAATSPFALLGSMFGGGGEELRYQVFLPGESDPTAESVQRLATLRRALTERPALTLELEAGFDPGELYELKRRQLDRMIRQRVWDKLRAEDATVPPVEDLLVSSGNRADVIMEIFYQTFGGRTRSNAPSSEPVPAAATPERPPVTQATSEPASPAASTPPPPVMVRPEPPLPRIEERPERRGLFRRAFDVATLKGVRERLWGEDEPPPTERPAPAREPAPPPRPVARNDQPAPVNAAAEEPVPVAPAAVSSAAGATSASQLPPVPLDVSPAEMEQRLIDAMPAGPDNLVALAEARAQRVKELLLEGGRIEPERVQIVDVSEDAGTNGPRVTLHLR